MLKQRFSCSNRSYFVILTHIIASKVLHYNKSIYFQVSYLDLWLSSWSCFLLLFLPNLTFNRSFFQNDAVHNSNSIFVLKLLPLYCIALVERKRGNIDFRCICLPFLSDSIHDVELVDESVPSCSSETSLLNDLQSR